jgi:hypothetical protein
MTTEYPFLIHLAADAPHAIRGPGCAVVFHGDRVLVVGTSATTMDDLGNAIDSQPGPRDSPDS